MTPAEISRFLDSIASQKARTLVIVDYSNVCKWNENLKWSVGIPQLSNLIKHFSTGNRSLRRFYFGADCGRWENPQDITPYSSTILTLAKNNGFEVVQKPVKYIRDDREQTGYKKKCDLDVEMAVDMVRLQPHFDHVVVFSGDGDLTYALKYLHDTFGTTACVMGARGHIGKEIPSAKQGGFINLLFADDFEARLDKNRRG